MVQDEEMGEGELQRGGGGGSQDTAWGKHLVLLIKA